MKPRTMRKAYLSGDDGDFSISSMSADSSQRANKSTLNKTSTAVAPNPLGKIFGKNYFVDGEQLLRHISPSQPVRSPRDSANCESNAHNSQCINLLNVTTDMNQPTQPNEKVPQHLRLHSQHSGGKRSSKTTRGKSQTQTKHVP